jgi:hypothetical protein
MGIRDLHEFASALKEDYKSGVGQFRPLSSASYFIFLKTGATGDLLMVIEKANEVLEVGTNDYDYMRRWRCPIATPLKLYEHTNPLDSP